MPDKYSSSTDFQNYFSGKMSAAQKEAFYENAQKDSFEKEALEGFEKVDSPDEVSAMLHHLNNTIQETTGIKKERAIGFPLWKSLGVAATVLLLIGIGFSVTYFLEKDDSVAQNTTYQNEDDISPEVSISEKENQITLVEIDSQNMVLEDTEAIVEKENIKSSKPQNVAPIQIVSDEIAIPHSVTEETSVETSSAFIEEEIIVSDTHNSISEDKNDMSQEIAKKESRSKSSYELAQQLYNEKQYKAAKNYFEKAKQQGKKIAESNYYLAMCDYYLGKHKAAKIKFSNIINANSSYTQDAKWFKALIHINEGEKQEAKLLLKQLVNDKTKYKQDAKEKLKSLH